MFLNYRFYKQFDNYIITAVRLKLNYSIDNDPNLGCPPKSTDDVQTIRGQ